MNWCLIALGGALGSVSRYLVATAAGRIMVSQLPLGILAVNVIGSLLIGIASGLLPRWNFSTETQALISTGFLGGFTTFSAYAFGTMDLFLAGEMKAALLNVLLNNGVCLAAVGAGIILARQFHA